MAFANNSRQQQQKRQRRYLVKKLCPFDRDGIQYFDYKDYPLLKPYVDYFGSIRKRYYTGVCLKHQKMLKNAVERARFLGMLAYRK